MGFGYQKDFSSAGDYAKSAFFGGLFGAANTGKAATSIAKEGKLTMGTELKLLGQEAREFGRGAKEIAKAFGEGVATPVRGTNANMLGLNDVAERLSKGVDNVLKSPALKNSPYHPDRVSARIKELWNKMYSKHPWKEDAYHGSKPEYRNIGHHDETSTNFRGGGDTNTTLLPDDAALVYRNAIPRSDGKVWYGRNSNKEFYRYSTDEEGFVHWSGRENSTLGLKVPSEIKARFRNLDKDLEDK